MPNADVAFTLDQAVSEVLNLLTGHAFSHVPKMERYYSITQTINRALRIVATEADWSYYSSTEEVGVAHAGDRNVNLRPTVRPRILIDDSVRLVDDNDYPRVWAHFLPREAIHKVPDRSQLWVSHARSELEFSRPFSPGEEGLRILVPVMREPRMYRLPERPEDLNDPIPEVPQEIRDTIVDFEWPDMIVLKTAYLYAQTDPIMQPRVQTLEANYKDLMYAMKDRDTKFTDAPFMNPYTVPVDGSIYGTQNVSHVPYGDKIY
jgi:hypothetical protein